MTPPVKDISAALAYQVKKEIAENYFGTRKALEEEREDLLRERKKLEEVWTRGVLPHLIRICQTLVGQGESQAFLKLIQREDLLPRVQPDLKSPSDDLSPAECAIPFALTAKGKFKKLVFSLYQSAKIKEDALWNTFRSHQKKVGLFNEDLAQFTSCYNLSDILSLVHSVENRDDLRGVLGENSDPRAIPLLEEKMILKSIDPGREEGAFLRPLPPLKEIQSPLKLLLDLAFQTHCSEIKKKLQPI
ncbi:MAG: hypothetical protein HY787_07175 [Deltaproteobacteria bacterium]|nr:hypothetical protein [Deltaproteobacteria bacterium]